MAARWEGVVLAKQAARAKLIAPYLVGLPKGSRTIASDSLTSIDDVDDLVKLMSTGKLMAHDVISAYIKRAVEAHQKTNCLTEVFFDEALKEAARLDEHYHNHCNLIGPLHGVPITLKDQFDVEGADSTIGYVSRAFRPVREDAALVQILKDLGAVIIAKTNLPQSIMTFTPGGSTGGEGALLALHGSIIGYGTDIGGSIRIPSHMNGLYGLKPTSSRLPYQGVAVSTDGQGHVPSSVGPMARSLSTIIAVMKYTIDRRPWLLDPNVTPINWRQGAFEEVQSRPLTIGILVDDGIVKVHPPIERALRSLESRLRAAGHETVPWDSSGHKECIEIMDLFYSADGGEDIRTEVNAGGEPFIPHVETLTNLGAAISVYDYWQLNKRKVFAQQSYNKKWNKTQGASGRVVDIVLMPTMPHVAVPHRSCRWVGYTKIWNVLDYTALSFPAGRVDETIDLKPENSYKPRNELDAWNWSLYDPRTMSGHPVGLQLVGRRFEEEKVLGAALVIERLLKHKGTQF
ncbi:hypothetical protein FKW77_000668 [Venturia effusa]|uniref:Amidase domain-containing protein n=1 Tax=Venturia effusa TaxID=50376 RepID=A0A517L8H6_9PEZI|nr:hypothetical protein FKW77_000668 [Venturia effusa]